ncbi:unnamed protein product [Hermetia illucens]|uniref:Uncharacterized protein n=1 Tax=Hermetia illucens TaxID=343691 RepID=A0A7R8UMY6_HERIL|nr:unnamed protein product [Hermetia illucens]
MAKSTLIKNIKKFDGSNFQAWKFRMNSMLIANSIQDVVTGARVISADADSADGKKWVKDNATAMCIVSSSIEDSQLDCMLNCTTAKQMWDNLVRIHEQKSVSNKMLLLQKFHGYRKESRSGRSDFGHGHNSEKYNALQIAWDSVSEERQTLDNLLERLLKEERRLEGDDDITRALATFILGGNKKKKFAANQNKNMKENNENRNKSVECFYCKRKRHLACDCRKKKRDTDNPNENPRECAFVASTREHKQQQVKSETVPNSEVVERLMAVDTSDVWITDSGASRHITYRRDWYSEFESSSGELISLGDKGVCEVTGSGAREANVSTVNLRVWHERMGHVNNKVLREMTQKGLIRGVKLADIDNFFCESCAFGKAHRLSFKKNETNRKTKPAEYIHSDVCGPFSTSSRSVVQDSA